MGGHREDRSMNAIRESTDHHLMAIVISYVVSVAALSGVMLAMVVKFGYRW